MAKNNVSVRAEQEKQSGPSQELFHIFLCRKFVLDGMRPGEEGSKTEQLIQVATAAISEKQAGESSNKIGRDVPRCF